MRYTCIQISGKVQGTGFREFVRKKATGLVGFVRNKTDGSVEIIVGGDQKKIDQLVKECGKGPFLAAVKNVSVIPIESDEEYDSFFIKH